MTPTVQRAPWVPGMKLGDSTIIEHIYGAVCIVECPCGARRKSNAAELRKRAAQGKPVRCQRCAWKAQKAQAALRPYHCTVCGTTEIKRFRKGANKSKCMACAQAATRAKKPKAPKTIRTKPVKLWTPTEFAAALSSTPNKCHRTRCANARRTNSIYCEDMCRKRAADEARRLRGRAS